MGVGFITRIKSKAVQYWREPFIGIHHGLIDLPPAGKLILTAFLSSIAALCQSAGGYVLGIGFFVSAMTTFPIYLAAMLSIRHGLLSFFVTFLLLLLIQPSELLIFSFTTGLLGIVLGAAIYLSKNRRSVVFLAGAALFIGIVAVLYIFRFPVLGPGIGTSFHFSLLLLVAIFGIMYAWIAAEACSFALKRLVHALPDRISGRKKREPLKDGSAQKEPEPNER